MPGSRPPTVPELSRFVLAHRAEILAEWERAVRLRPMARALSRPALLDHIPQLLERIALAPEEIGRGTDAQPPIQLAEQHAAERLDEGFDLSQVVTEYALLRDVILRRWAEAAQPSSGGGELRTFNAAIDRLIAIAVDRYVRERERAVDRIGTVALESRDLDELLTRLLAVFVESTAAIDTTAILLRDGDVLRVRAAIGLEREVALGLSLRIGEGFAGRIFAERRARLVHNAANDPLVASDVIREKGVRALYGVPLIDGDEVIGVAHIGSLTAYDFPEQDKHLFAAMTRRATAIILQHLLRESAERARVLAEEALAQRDAFLDASPIGAAFVDRDLRYVRLNETLAAMNGRPVAEHLGRTVRELLPGVADMIEPLLRQTIETGQPVRAFEVRWATPGEPGEPRNLLVTYFPVHRREEIIGAGGLVVDITEQRRSEEALRVSEARLRSLIDHAPAAIFIHDAAGRCVLVNERAAEVMGRGTEEMLGRTNRELLPREVADQLDANERLVLESGGPLEFEEVMPGDGGTRTFLSIKFPLPGPQGQPFLCGISKDITDRKRTEEEQRFLAEASAILASSLDYRETLRSIAALASPRLADWCLIHVLQPDGSLPLLVVAHPDAAKVELAWEIDHRYPMHIDARHGPARVLRSGRSELAAELTESMLAAAARDAEHGRLILGMGLRSGMAIPLKARGKAVGALTLLSAESGRRFGPRDVALAEELGRRAALAVDNARLYAEAQEATRLREEALAIVSHDLRTPLGAIKMTAQLLSQQAAELHGGGDPQLATILRATIRMERLIGDLLNLAAIQSGRLSIEARPCDAATLVREVFELAEPPARDKGITLRAELPAEPVEATCDRERILQVLSNLLGNAIKFSGKGGTVVLRAERQAQAVLFCVTDSGPGISIDELPHVFEPYWSARRHVRTGTGLGLYISRSIVEAHGGRMWVESVPGRGSRFYFTLPLA